MGEFARRIWPGAGLAASGSAGRVCAGSRFAHVCAAYICTGRFKESLARTDRAGRDGIGFGEDSRMNRKALPVCAVLLAGGRGTRFWPRSRMRTPKQLLNITGDATMLRQTVQRLESVVDLRNMWVVTNVEQAARVRREMRGTPPGQVLAEPVG